MNKARYQKSKNNKLCPNCKNEPKKGKVYCEECLQKTKEIINNLIKNSICPGCRHPIDEYGTKTKCSSCAAKHRNRTNIKRQLVKDEVFKYYGGYSCYCCGETTKQFLTIDHINDDGANHRKQCKSANGQIYRWLKKQNFPSGYKVLCFNCNCGRHLNNGICPHKISEEIK